MPMLPNQPKRFQTRTAQLQRNVDHLRNRFEHAKRVGDETDMRNIRRQLRVTQMELSKIHDECDCVMVKHDISLLTAPHQKEYRTFANMVVEPLRCMMYTVVGR